ncbi:MAG: hypothetical protein WAU86_06400 [Oricola sp.]
MADLTKHTLFKPTRLESRQATTDSVARSMMEADEAARKKKTERLRQMRLEAQPDEEEPAKSRSGKARKKAAPKGRTKTS